MNIATLALVCLEVTMRRAYQIAYQIQAISSVEFNSIFELN